MRARLMIASAEPAPTHESPVAIESALEPLAGEGEGEGKSEGNGKGTGAPALSSLGK